MHVGPLSKSTTNKKPRIDSTYSGGTETVLSTWLVSLDQLSGLFAYPALAAKESWTPLWLHGDADPRWACVAVGERPPRFSFREPDLAHLTATGLTLVDRPSRFRFQVDAEGTLHLMHDGYPVGKAAPSERASEQLPRILTALADLRVQPEALAQFLLAVPDEVLRRCGVILAQTARRDGETG